MLKSLPRVPFGAQVLAGLVLGARFPARWVFAGIAAAFAVHVVIATAAGSLLSLLPRRPVEAVVGVLFLLGAVLIWFFGVYLRPIGLEVGYEDGQATLRDHTPDEVARYERQKRCYTRLSALGLVLLVLGFGAQIWSNYVPATPP